VKYLYKKLSPFKRRAYNAKYRAKKYQADGSFTSRTICNLYVRQRGKCAVCFEFLFGKFETDHIMPLSRGGNNKPENIQLVCPKCNKIKGDKIYGN
jgi:5-methylcytosine-specific restriction endonuclease McrA